MTSTNRSHQTIGIAAAAILAAGFAAAAMAPQVRAEQTLKFATSVPIENPTIKNVFGPWAEGVNKDSAGEFQIKLYGVSLATGRNVWERTLNGVADIGWGVSGAVGLPFPKTYVSSLPLLVEDGEAGAASVALWRLYERGLIADEYKDAKLLGLVALPVQGLSLKTPIKKLADVKGLKVRAADKQTADIVGALGGAPVSIPATEVYQGLSRGVVDASIANWIMMGAFRLSEVTTDSVGDLPLGSPPGFMIMNKRSWDRLSEKAKAVLEKHSGAVLSRHMGAGLEGMANFLRSNIKKDGNHRFIDLDSEEEAKWRAALQEVIESWARETPNGKQILTAFREELAKAKAK